MRNLGLALALVAAVTLAATVASASPKQHVRHARAAPSASVQRAPDSMQPPRMIEARPGVFVSSYGCITDDGYGRWLYCGQGRGGD